MSEMWIPKVLASGRIVDLADLTVDDIRPEDLVAGMNQPRFGLMTSRPYTIAEHSVVLWRYCYRRHSEVVADCALVHDLAEVYVGDLHGPLKASPGFDAYRRIEDRVQAVIEDWLDVEFSPHVRALVTILDKRLTEYELRHFWPRTDFSILGKRPTPLDVPEGDAPGGERDRESFRLLLLELRERARRGCYRVERGGQANG